MDWLYRKLYFKMGQKFFYFVALIIFLQKFVQFFFCRPH